jgi:hypothetical protein
MAWLFQVAWFKNMSYGLDWLSGGRFCGCSSGAHLLALSTLLMSVVVSAAGVYAWYAWIRTKPVKVVAKVEEHA